MRLGGVQILDSTRRQFESHTRLCCAVLVKPLAQPTKSVFRGILVVTGTIVSIETITRVRVDHSFRLSPRSFHRRAHLFHRVSRNSPIFTSIHPEQRRFELGGDINRVGWMKFVGSTDESSVPGDASFKL